MSAPSSVLRFCENSISPFTTPVLPITTFSADILPSKCPNTSTLSASISPEIDPVSLITTSLDITGPLIKPAMSIDPELFTVPSILTVSLIKDLSVSFLSPTFFLSDPNLLFNFQI